jgi:hypothetical protein
MLHYLSIVCTVEKKNKITVIINLACNLYRIIDIYITDYTNIPVNFEGCRGRDRMVVVFTTTYAISAYHH